MRHALIGAMMALAAALVLSTMAAGQTARPQAAQAKSPWVYYPLDTITGDGGAAPKRDLSGTGAGPGSTDAIPRGAAARPAGPQPAEADRTIWSRGHQRSVGAVLRPARLSAELHLPEPRDVGG